MYPYIGIGGIEISVWHIFLFTGYAFALTGILLTRPRDLPISGGMIIGCVLIYIIASIIGCIILNILIHTENLIGVPLQFVFNELGFASLGGIVLGIVAVWIFSREAKFSFIDIADFGMPFVVLVLAFNRIGCLMAGCCEGIATNLPWGYNFLEDGVLRHPTQGYEMAVNFAIFASSRFIYKHLRQYKGLTFYYIMFVYSFMRLFNEFLRNEGPRITGQVKFSHPFLLMTAIIGIIGIRRCLIPAAAEKAPKIWQLLRGALIRFVIVFFVSISLALTLVTIVTRMGI